MRSLEDSRRAENGQTGSWRGVRGGHGSRHRRCRFRVLQTPILGTADGEYWHRLGLRSFLLEIPQASMIAVQVSDDVEINNRPAGQRGKGLLRGFR